MWFPDPRHLKNRALALLLACQTWTLASAECAPYPLSTKIRNVTLSNGQVSRGIALSVGTPEQDFAFLPQWPLNNTLIYGTNGFCTSPAPPTENGCTTWRGGQYDQLASRTRKLPNEATYPNDSKPYPKMNFISDIIGLNSNVSLPDFPMGIALHDWAQEGYHPLMAVGLGLNSTLLNILKATGKIASRSWSMFYGLTGANSNTQLDGTFVLGGYDRAKVAGKGYTQALSTNTNCPSHILITITDISLNFPNGTTASLFPKSLSSSISACVVPDYPVLMTMPRDPYFNSFETLTSTTLSSRSFGLAYFSMLYNEDDKPYTGDLTFTLQSGLTIRIPNDQLVVPELTIDDDTGGLQANNTARNLIILPTQDINANDISQLGRQFLSGAYLMVNLDAGDFTIWASNPTSDEDLVAVDTNGVEVTEFCATESDSASRGENSKQRNSSLPAGAIAGIVVGVVLFLAALGIIAFFLFRRQKEWREAKGANAAALRPAESCKPELDSAGCERRIYELPPTAVDSNMTDSNPRIYELVG